MSEANEANPRNRREDLNKEVYRLLLFYKKLTQLLETFFSGYLLLSTDEINRSYLRLCIKIKEILDEPGFESLAGLSWQPFDSLRTLDPDASDIEWEYGGRQVCGTFLNAVEELFIKNGEMTYPLDADDQELLGSIDIYLEKYRSWKNDYEKRWVQGVEKLAEEWEKKQGNLQVGMPQFDFGFVRDGEIKRLIIEVWKEAQKAFHNKLGRSTVVLCGAILEALLIDALSCIKEEAKLSYVKCFKNKGNSPPEIENWKLYQLVEIAKQQGIISNDVAKLSGIIKEYRNLIHLWAQKRKQLQPDLHVASAVVSLLTIAYNNTLGWHKKRKDG